MELWDKKKDKLFGDEIGNYRVIFSQKLNTCLAGNIYNQKLNTGSGDKYFIFVIDLVTDETLLSYQTFGSENVDNGMTLSEAMEKYESYGLKIF